MHNLLYLFEHETVPFSWTDQDLTVIERLNHTVGGEILHATAQNGQRVLQAREYVGVFRFGKHTVQVLPKIYRSSSEKNEGERARQATHNLLYLLSYAGQLPISEQAIAPLLKRNLDWFEILTRLFAAHLLEEWQHGAYSTYRTIEDDLPYLRGKWRVTDQIRRPERGNLFSVSFDEFTADNNLNQIFRFVVERLWHLSHDAENHRILGILRQWMEDITLPTHVTLADAETIPLTRLNQHLEPLLNLARIFLDNSTLQLAEGLHGAFVFVFDMNILYEAFVANFIRKHRDEILQQNLYDCDLLPQSRGASRFLARCFDRPMFRLRPDLAFRIKTEFPLLLDTKYKRLDATDARLGVRQADFYQMYAYAQRYHCPRVLLLYPQMADMPSSLHSRFNIEEENREICVETLDLRVDLSRYEGKQHLIDQFRTILGDGQ